MNKIVKNSLILASVALAIDFIFHYFYSAPMETFTYFLVKFVLVFLIGLWVFKKDTTTSLVIGTVVFVSIFAGYYRAWEFLYGYSFGYRVPDIILSGKIISWEEMPSVVTLIWAIIHGVAFALPAYIIGDRNGKN